MKLGSLFDGAGTCCFAGSFVLEGIAETDKEKKDEFDPTRRCSVEIEGTSR